MLIFQNHPRFLASNFVDSNIIIRCETTKPAVYQVNGASLTFLEVQKTAPEQRTVAHWQVLLDWERQRTQPYVIVDPFDPSGLLYFSEVEYKIQARTLGSMNTPFIVVARPGSNRPPSQNFPTLKYGTTFFEEFDPITWRAMKNLRSFIARNVKWTKTGVVRVNDRNIMGLVWLWSRELFHQLGENGWAKRQGQLVDFVRHLRHVLRHNGSTFAIQRLKISLFALYSWLGGNPLKNTHELGQRIRLRNGLPIWLPRNALRRSKKTGLRAVRLWASLLNIYKYIYGKHPTPPLETITKPGFRGDWSQFREFCENDDGFMARLWLILGFVPKFKYKTHKGLIVRTAGSNHAVSFVSAPADSFAWSQAPVNWVKRWFTLWGDKEMIRLMESIKSKFDPKCRGSNPCEFCLCKPRLGRLHPIEEAAGKVRVVAICDYFTQVALKPLHDYIFELLRKLPTDATFDQQGAVDRFAALGHKEIFSFDLKAATDLIPMELYYVLMRELIGFRGASIWKQMLTDRDFYAPESFKRPDRDLAYPDGFLVRYTRGQPMGALSSWAALALLHHALVQYAAWRVDPSVRWFSDYLVLGDDVVIAGDSVAQSYLEICEALGITVGIAKSLISREGLMNFASQTVYQGHNVSPLSLKEEIAAQNTTLRVALVERVFARWGGDKTDMGYLKRILTEPQWSAVSDGGIRGSGSRTLNLVRFLLENPFRKEELTSGNVLNWLGFVDPELRSLPNVLRSDFETFLKAYALEDVVKMLAKRIREVNAVKRHIKDFCNEWEFETVESDGIYEVTELVTRTSDVPESSPEDDSFIWPILGGRPGLMLESLFGHENRVYAQYVLDSLSQSVDTVVLNKLKELREELKPFMYKTYVLEGVAQLPDNCPDLVQIIGWYNRLMDIPNMKIEKDASAERTLFGLFKKIPDETPEAPGVKTKRFSPPWKDVKETISGPLASVSKALVSVMGVFPPIDLILNRPQSNICKMLRRLRALQLVRWGERDASPVMAECSMALTSATSYGGSLVLSAFASLLSNTEPKEEVHTDYPNFVLVGAPYTTGPVTYPVSPDGPKYGWMSYEVAVEQQRKRDAKDPR